MIPPTPADPAEPEEPSGSLGPSGPSSGGDRRRPVALVAGLALVVLGAVVLVAALAGRDGSDVASTPSTGSVTTGSTAPPATPTTIPPGTTAPTTPAGVGVGWAPEVRGRTPLRGFGEVAVVVTDADGKTCEACLLAATTQTQHARGLMEVTDPALGGYDGMLFLFDREEEGAFWMRDTPMPLSIAYLDADGRFVSAVDMAPCGDEPGCPGYPPEGPFAFALEVPQGHLGDLRVAEGSHLRVVATTCPLADPSP